MSDDTQDEETFDPREETIIGLSIAAVAAVLYYIGQYMTALTITGDGSEVHEISFVDLLDQGIVGTNGPGALLALLALMTVENRNWVRYICWALIGWITLTTCFWLYMVWFREPVIAMYLMAVMLDAPMSGSQILESILIIEERAGEQGLQKMADATSRGIWHQILMIVAVGLYWFAFMVLRDVQFHNMHVAQMEGEE